MESITVKFRGGPKDGAEEHKPLNTFCVGRRAERRVNTHGKRKDHLYQSRKAVGMAQRTVTLEYRGIVDKRR